MNDTTIRRVTEQAVTDKQRELSVTAKDSPRHAEVQAELAELQKHLGAKNAVVALAAKLGYRRNQYDGKCCKTAAPVKALAGFAKKSVDGRWQTYCWDVVQAETGYVFEG
jgi:L-rhamnose mutarotase